jgi:rubrerythrin
MESSTSLSNVMYDILRAMGEDAEFLYDAIDTYIKDAQSANNSNLVDTGKKIKADRQSHINMLKDALEQEIHAEKR